MKKPLTQTDWIEAGFIALTNGGPQAIKVEAIARTLKVSKGSFYWHFKDAPALKSAMLEHWMRVATADVIDVVEGGPKNAADQLRQLIEISAAGLHGRMVEAAIRDWARYDETVANLLGAVDKNRVGFVLKLFKSHGISESKCASHASILYSALIGLEATLQHAIIDPAEALNNLLELLLTDI